MKHGANIYKYAKTARCKTDELIDFSSNINSYQPANTLKPTNTMLVKYADSSYSNLKSTIAKNYNIQTENIALYNGATSAIYELLQHLKQDRVYLYSPLYSEYEKAVQKGVDVVKINRFKNLYKKPKKGSIVVFVNPSTPDGKGYDLARLFSIWKKQKCIIILDESFIEFKRLKSLKNQINNYNKLYIIQSFTKFYSCAGVRIGAIISNKSNINRFKIPIWNLSSFDVAFLTHRLKDSRFKQKTLKIFEKQKKQLWNILDDSKLFSRLYKSDANFILVEMKNKTIKKRLFKHLLERKILVRDCNSFDFLLKTHLRFAVKDSNSHKALTHALSIFETNKQHKKRKTK